MVFRHPFSIQRFTNPKLFSASNEKEELEKFHTDIKAYLAYLEGLIVAGRREKLDFHIIKDKAQRLFGEYKRLRSDVEDYSAELSELLKNHMHEHGRPHDAELQSHIQGNTLSINTMFDRALRVYDEKTRNQTMWNKEDTWQLIVLFKHIETVIKRAVHEAGILVESARKS
ncbi:MAG: hypothetical protein QF632_03305 [Candidatus Woesearchaeota archaeon]|jgi:hypothetical protein|nr:hypothetical protein [Candidatus Woesearchaeota archaeon]|tara:strand:+ start:468 stop:980 length:513 start_codon:yes stop_codon:yes gene_type:complete